MKTFLPATCLAVALALAAIPAAAALAPDVLAKNQWIELTRADYEAALARVPEKMRFEFATSPKRVQDVLNALLLDKTLAAQARAHGTKAGDAFAGEPNSDKALAAAELERVEADARKEFAAQKAVFEQKARELYATDREAYRAPEQARISDIAVLVKGRGDDAARARAGEAHAKIAAGADFAAVAREYSDDSAAREKGGALPLVPRTRMAPTLAKAVFALKVGELSQPIKGPTAWHVVRLDELRPSYVRSFDDVRDGIMRTLETRYVKEKRDLRIKAVYQDPTLETNQPAIDALVNRVDPSVFKPKPQAAAK